MLGGASRGGSVLSLRMAFLSVALGIVVLFLALIGYLGYSQIAREKVLGQQQALTHARALATQIETLLGARLDGLMAAAEAVAAAGGNAGAIEAPIRRLRQSFPDMGQVLVVDPLGAGVASTTPFLEGRRLAVGDQSWFKRAAISTQPFVGDPRQVGPNVVVGLYAPARTADGQLRGVVAADLGLKRVQELLSRARLAEGAVAEVLSDRGLVVARHPALFLMKDVQGLAGYRDLLKGGEVLGELTFVDEEPRLMGSAMIRSVGWVLAVGLPSAQVLAPTKRLLAQVLGGVAVVTLLAVVLAVSLARRGSSGMERLRAAMSRLEAGDVPASVPVSVGGEMGALTEAFNRAALQKTVNEELRVALTALLDLPRLLGEVNKPLSAEERQKLEILHGRGEEILELIDNLVILSGLYTGQIKITKAPVNLPELVQRVVRSLQQRAASKGNRIQADMKPDVGQVVTDAKRLAQVLANLLVTSIKYTEVGEIRVTGYTRDGNVMLTVADDGAGFTAEEQQRIFEPFLPIAPRGGRGLPGTGLQLTVCQRLVQLLGGTIRVESEVDRGTWFTVSLPVQP